MTGRKVTERGITNQKETYHICLDERTTPYGISRQVEGSSKENITKHIQANGDVVPFTGQRTDHFITETQQNDE